MTSTFAACRRVPRPRDGLVVDPALPVAGTSKRSAAISATASGLRSNAIRRQYTVAATRRSRRIPHDLPESDAAAVSKFDSTLRLRASREDRAHVGQHRFRNERRRAVRSTRALFIIGTMDNGDAAPRGQPACGGRAPSRSIARIRIRGSHVADPVHVGMQRLAHRARLPTGFGADARNIIGGPTCRRSR